MFLFMAMSAKWVSEVRGMSDGCPRRKSAVVVDSSGEIHFPGSTGDGE